jgi:hypothetical protein
MGRHHYAAGHPLGSHWHLWTVVETAHGLTFRTLLETDRGADANAPEPADDRVRCTLCHGSRTRSPPICQHSPGAIVAVESEQGALVRDLVRRQVTTNGRETLAQFRPVAPIAFVPNTAEPLEAMSLADDSPRPDHLPALASRVTRGERPDLTGERAGAELRSGVKRVGARPLASHRCQTPPRHYLLDLSSPQFGALAPADG